MPTRGKRESDSRDIQEHTGRIAVAMAYRPYRLHDNAKMGCKWKISRATSLEASIECTMRPPRHSKTIGLSRPWKIEGRPEFFLVRRRPENFPPSKLKSHLKRDAQIWILSQMWGEFQITTINMACINSYYLKLVPQVRNSDLSFELDKSFSAGSWLQI